MSGGLVCGLPKPVQSGTEGIRTHPPPRGHFTQIPGLNEFRPESRNFVQPAQTPGEMTQGRRVNPEHFTRVRPRSSVTLFVGRYWARSCCMVSISTFCPVITALARVSTSAFLLVPCTCSAMLMAP